EVEVPVRSAYDQWTQFESFPRFMEGVRDVEQLTDERTHWVVSVAGVTREFDATITEQQPDEKVAWASDDEPAQVGVVTFAAIGPDRRRVTLQLARAPEGAPHRPAAAPGTGWARALGAASGGRGAGPPSGGPSPALWVLQHGQHGALERAVDGEPGRARPGVHGAHVHGDAVEVAVNDARVDVRAARH